MKTIEEIAKEYADRHKNAYLTISSDMKREEQMFQTVEQEHGKISRREALIALTAMEWADKTMIDKACDILSDLGVFNWMADNAQEWFSAEVHKDQFVKCLTEE